MLVYRAETFYFAHMHGWQAGLVGNLTKKYWDWGYSRENEPNYEFASDEVVQRFWEKLDAERLDERFLLEIDPANTTTTQFIACAMERAASSRSGWDARGPGHPHGGFHLNSGRALEDGQTLAAYDVEADDLFGLIIEYEPLGLYSIIPLPDSETVFAAIRSVDESPPHPPQVLLERTTAVGEQPARPLLGALLLHRRGHRYSDVRPESLRLSQRGVGPFTTAVRHRATGGELSEASRYWKGVVDERLQREWTILGWLRTKPYDPQPSLRRHTPPRLFPDELPCLVLFDRLDQADKLVFPLLCRQR